MDQVIFTFSDGKLIDVSYNGGENYLAELKQIASYATKRSTYVSEHIQANATGNNEPVG